MSNNNWSSDDAQCEVLRGNYENERRRTMTTKTKVEYTKGPWSYTKIENDGYHEPAKVLAHDKETLVADCFCLNGLSSEESEANARLIAAAPELLEALETCFDNAKLFNRDTDACWVVVRDMCEAAIRKARGE
jgi:hypothetical protein